MTVIFFGSPLFSVHTNISHSRNELKVYSFLLRDSLKMATVERGRKIVAEISAIAEMNQRSILAARLKMVTVER